MIVNDGYPQLRECDQFLDEIDRIVSSLAGGRLSQVIITTYNNNKTKQTKIV